MPIATHIKIGRYAYFKAEVITSTTTVERQIGDFKKDNLVKDLGNIKR